MRLRALLADILPNLKLAQLFYNKWTDKQPDQQRRQARKHRTKRKVAKYSKQPEVGKQLLVQQPIKQTVSAFSPAAYAQFCESHGYLNSPGPCSLWLSHP